MPVCSLFRAAGGCYARLVSSHGLCRANILRLFSHSYIHHSSCPRRTRKFAAVGFRGFRNAIKSRFSDPSDISNTSCPVLKTVVTKTRRTRKIAAAGTQQIPIFRLKSKFNHGETCGESRIVSFSFAHIFLSRL